MNVSLNLNDKYKNLSNDNSFFTKYNHIMKNCINTNKDQSFISVSVEKNHKPRENLLTNFINKKENKNNCVSVSQKISELKINLLLKQSNLKMDGKSRCKEETLVDSKNIYEPKSNIENHF